MRQHVADFLEDATLLGIKPAAAERLLPESGASTPPLLEKATDTEWARNWAARDRETLADSHARLAIVIDAANQQLEAQGERKIDAGRLGVVIGRRR